MSNLQFESLRHEISHLVHTASAPMIAPDLFDACNLASDKKQFVDCVFNMVKNDELARHPAPEGSGKGVKFAYGPGNVKPGAERGNAAGGGNPKTEPKARRAKAAHKKRSQGVQKVQRRNATSRRGAAAHGIRRSGPASPRYQRWALTDEGTFIVLGAREPIEVEPNVARKLLELVRGGADLAGLAAFIEKLDKGQA